MESAGALSTQKKQEIETKLKHEELLKSLNNSSPIPSEIQGGCPEFWLNVNHQEIRHPLFPSEVQSMSTP
jgi:hypothetical protein